MNRRCIMLILYVASVAFLLLAASCTKENRCDTPIGDASCTLNLFDASLSDLWSINGYLFLIGGNKGICITHPSNNEYRAFERTCPHDHDAAVNMQPNSDGLILECPVCGSQFLAIDGTPLEGSATSCSLYQYETKLDGSILYIW